MEVPILFLRARGFFRFLDPETPFSKKWGLRALSGVRGVGLSRVQSIVVGFLCPSLVLPCPSRPASPSKAHCGKACLGGILDALGGSFWGQFWDESYFLTFQTVFFTLDGPAIRNANRGDSRAEKKSFHNLRAIRVNRLKPAIRNFWPPEARFAKKKGSVWEPCSDSRESGDSRESANRFARIGPSKFFTFLKQSPHFEKTPFCGGPHRLYPLILADCPKTHPKTHLAAQCERPPIAQYLFEIVSQRGVLHPFALFS